MTRNNNTEWIPKPPPTVCWDRDKIKDVNAPSHAGHASSLSAGMNPEWLQLFDLSNHGQVAGQKADTTSEEGVGGGGAVSAHQGHRSSQLGRRWSDRYTLSGPVGRLIVRIMGKMWFQKGGGAPAAERSGLKLTKDIRLCPSSSCVAGTIRKEFMRVPSIVMGNAKRSCVKNELCKMERCLWRSTFHPLNISLMWSCFGAVAAAHQLIYCRRGNLDFVCPFKRESSDLCRSITNLSCWQFETEFTGKIKSRKMKFWSFWRDAPITFFSGDLTNPSIWSIHLLQSSLGTFTDTQGLAPTQQG